MADLPKNIDIILLAAGASARMRGQDKLLLEINGEPLLRRAARAALAARAKNIYVVLPPENTARQRAVEGLGLNLITAPACSAGMGASLRAGMAGLGNCDGVIIALADMPDITAQHFNLLCAGFDPAKGHEICRATTSDGQFGHPVLFGKRFFKALSRLEGDQGARDIITASEKFLVNVKTPGQGAIIDLDTAQDWQSWRKGAGY